MSAKQKQRLLLCRCRLQKAENHHALVFLVVSSLFVRLFCISRPQLAQHSSVSPSFLWELRHSFDQHPPSFPESLSLWALILLFAAISTNFCGADSRQRSGALLVSPKPLKANCHICHLSVLLHRRIFKSGITDGNWLFHWWGLLEIPRNLWFLVICYHLSIFLFIL